MSKLYQTFQSPYSLHKPPYTILFHTSYLPQWVCCQISENIFFFLNLLVQKLFFDNSSLTLWLIPAPFYLKSISLLFIIATLLYLATISSCIFAAGEETSEPEVSYCDRWKLFSYSSPSHLLPETFPSALCLSLVFLVFIFWLIETTTTNLQGLTHSNQSGSTNQVTLSNEHMNHFFWAYINLVHYRINPCFPLFMFWWPKEGRACLIAQRQWHLRYDILKNKKFDVKKLIPKILEEFSVVTTWPLQTNHFSLCSCTLNQYKRLLNWRKTFKIIKQLLAKSVVCDRPIL